MIAGIFHQGSGLGNQLHRYIATRVLALDKGCEWGMIYNPDGSGKEEGFKGKSFFKGDFLGKGDLTKAPFYIIHPTNKWEEKKIVENGVDIRGYDPEINFVEDNTLIDGEFQDERYWIHREKEVNEWLAVEPMEMPDDLCVIGFRGGEFSVFPDLFLTEEYWNKAIKRMLTINPKMRFEVHTDDLDTAKKFFPTFPIIHDIGINWRSMRYARYAIIANSSFFILPRWLKHGEVFTDWNNWYSKTIAPRYWARHNIKMWALPQNYYQRFEYL